MKLPLLLLALAACGGGGSKSTEAPTAKTWKDMNTEQRQQYMKDVVLPETKKLFVAFDPKFAAMDCKTCHGAGAEDGTWTMPNPKIRALPNTEEAFMAWMQKEPDMGKWAQFMGGQLEPAMAKMLGKTQFDPKTKTGDFGCMACHELKTEPGPKPAE